MNVEKLIHVPGRGTILLVRAVDGLVLPRLDDLVYYGNQLWLVTGIEYQRQLTDPVTYSPNIGLRVIAFKGKA